LKPKIFHDIFAFSGHFLHAYYNNNAHGVGKAVIIIMRLVLDH